MILNKFEKKDYFLSFLVAFFIFLYIFMTRGLIGFVRDEGFYMRTAENSAAWFQEIETDLKKGDILKPFTKKSINRYFEYNHEHPALVKNMFGFSLYIFNKKTSLLSLPSAIRLVAALFAAFLAILCYQMSIWFFNSRITAIVSPFFLFTMPHVFFHSHLACFDVPVMFFWSGTFLLFNRYLLVKTKKAAFLTAIFLGAALAVKHNAFFIPVLLLFNWLIFYFVSFKKTSPGKAFKDFFLSIPLVFWLFVFVTIPVYFLLWPWLWYDTFERFRWYLNFHAMHVNYPNYYFGEELASGPFPFLYPWVMSFFTTPLPQLIIFFGAISLFVSRIRANLKNEEGLVYFNFIMGALFPIFLIALPSVPIFGGIKHWFTGYPILIAAGTFFLCDAISRMMKNINIKYVRAITAVILVFGIIAVIPANIKFAKRGAAFYNALMGGAQGAANSVMQRNFWGYDIMDLVETLNKTAEKNARIFIMGGNEGLNWNSFEYMKKEGIIRNDIRGVNSIEAADYAFFFYEKQNSNVLYSIYDVFKTVRPLAVSETDSVMYSALFRRKK